MKNMWWVLVIVWSFVSCASLPPEGTPDILEARFKAEPEKVYDALVDILLTERYPIGTYEREEGIIVTQWKPYEYKGCTKRVSATMGLGVRQARTKLTAYLGISRDSKTFVQLQGVLRFRGPRPLDPDESERPLKEKTEYYQIISSVMEQLETKLGEKGAIQEAKVIEWR